jgi:hypothetical protein
VTLESQAVIASLPRLKSRRKQRLFAVACARMIWSLLPDCTRQAVECAERFADGLVTRREFHLAQVNTRESWMLGYGMDAYQAICYRVLYPDSLDAARGVATSTNLAYAMSQFRELPPAVDDSTHIANTAWRDRFISTFTRAQMDIIDCLAGQQAVIDNKCVSVAVGEIARAAYIDRNFDLMHILADALLDAGCTDEAVLDHCRSSKPHARGCWVLDSILGYH